MRQSPTHHRISDKRGSHVGRHRLVERVTRPARESLRRAIQSRAALAGSALACIALAASAGQIGQHSDPVAAAAAVDAPPAAATLDAAGSSVLDGAFAAMLQGTQAGDEAARAESERQAAEAAWLAENPPPVGGLDQAQMNNALHIVRAGQALGLPKRAFVIAVATALQESRLYNLASTRIAASYNYPHEGAGSDHDSVGLFQQRVSAGWGRLQDLMDPTYAATAFYRKLVQIRGWETMALTWAAQKVQVSAYPYAYAKHEWLAQLVVDALVPSP